MRMPDGANIEEWAGWRGEVTATMKTMAETSLRLHEDFDSRMDAQDAALHEITRLQHETNGRVSRHDTQLALLEAAQKRRLMSHAARVSMLVALATVILGELAHLAFG